MINYIKCNFEQEKRIHLYRRLLHMQNQILGEIIICCASIIILTILVYKIYKQQKNTKVEKQLK